MVSLVQMSSGNVIARATLRPEVIRPRKKTKSRMILVLRLIWRFQIRAVGMMAVVMSRKQAKTRTCKLMTSSLRGQGKDLVTYFRSLFAQTQ